MSDDNEALNDAPLTSTLQVPAPVATALTRFAAVTRKLAVWHAIGWTVFLFVVLLTLIGFGDRWLQLPQTARIIASMVAYAATITLATKLLSRAMRRRSPAEIARDLEAAVPNGELMERISTTVELAERDAQAASQGQSFHRSEGISDALTARVADEAAQQIEEWDVSLLPDRRPMERASRFAWAAAGFVLILCFIPTLHMPLLYARALLPWMNFARPSDTQINVMPGDARVVEGGALDIEAQLYGKLVSEARIEMRESNSDWRASMMSNDGEKKDSFSRKVGPIRAPMSYRVVAGDGISAEYKIEVMPRPDVTQLKLKVSYPAYTKLPPQTFDKANGDISVLKGSKVEVLVDANTSLSAAVLEFSNDRKLSMNVTKGEKGDTASATFHVHDDVQYKVVLRSSEGVGNPDTPLYSIRAVLDRAPQVAVIKPSVDENADQATMLSLETRAEDDFGITTMRLVVRSEKRTKPVTLQLQRPIDGDKVWMVTQPWDLAGMFLEDGELVTYRVEAVDTFGSIGRSDERRLKISSSTNRTSAKLLVELEKAQKQIESAHKLVNSVKKEASELRQLLRPENVSFQSAERLLLNESLRRIGQETRAAASILEKSAPQAEWVTLRQLVTALSNAFERFGTTELRPLESSAARAASFNSEAVTAGLDVLLANLPQTEDRIKFLHQALTSAQRYCGAEKIVDHAQEVSDSQQKLTPVLLGATAWTPRGTYVTGLIAEYYQGVNFDKLARRTVDTKFDYRNADLPGIGKENFSVRWQGQVLAPKAGRYVFRATADDGVRLIIDGKKLIDEWRMQNSTAFEAAIELTEGWHDIQIEYYQGGGAYEFVLRRSLPKAAEAPIPPEHLRHLAAPVADINAPGMREAIQKGASENAVQQALIREQTMVNVARNFPKQLQTLATLKPEADPEGQKESTEWDKEIRRLTAELAEIKAVSANLATPVAQWNEYSKALCQKALAVKARYARTVEEFAKKLASENFELAADLKKLQQNAEAAKRAFDALVEAAKQPKDENRTAAMARADAAIRAMAEDLKVQANEIASQLKAEENDTRKSLEERRMIQALEHKVEEMAQGPAEALERKLKESADPEALAKSQERMPNFGTLAAEMSKKAAEVAQAAEKMERAVTLRDALKEQAKDADAARELLSQANDAKNVAAQHRAANELKADANAIQAALEDAKATLSPTAAAKAQQALDQAKSSKPTETLSAASLKPNNPAPNSPEGKARDAARKELAEQSKKAEDAAAAVNSALAEAAQKLNGDPATALREAAQDLKNEAQALKANTNPAAAMEQAANAAREAQQTAENLAEQLTLYAQAAAQVATKPQDKAHADDLARLAAAIKNEADKQIAPASDYLDRARQSGADANALPQNERDQRAAEAQAEAQKLEALAQVAQQLNSPDANQQKAAHAALEKTLAEQGADKNVEAALKQADALQQLADKLESPNANGANANKDTPLPSAVIEAAEQTLAKQLGADEQQVDRDASAQRIGEIAQGLRNQAEKQRDVASRMSQAAAMAQQARENVKNEAPALAQALRKAQEATANAAKSAGAQQAPLDNAQKELAQAAQALDAEATQSASAPAEQLAKDLAKTANDLEKPTGEIAAAMAANPGKPDAQLQQAGQAARQAAGRAQELAADLQRAENAEDVAQADQNAAAGSREQLEAEVKAAIAALEKDGEIAANAKNDLAELAKEAAAGNQAQKNGANDQQGNQSAQGNQNGQSTPESLQAAAEQTRADAERLNDMAARMERLATAMRSGSPAQNSSAKNGAPRTPAADALQALANAEAAQQTGDAAEAAKQTQKAADLLEQAAEAARANAAGAERPGSNEAQAMAEGKPHSQAQGKGGKGQKTGSKSSGGKEGAKSAQSEKSKGGLAVDPPEGIPIDKTTWNRLPDDVRRDMLNAAGGRFPAEYEASIKRYFKNLASTREEKSR